MKAIVCLIATLVANTYSAGVLVNANGPLDIEVNKEITALQNGEIVGSTAQERSPVHQTDGTASVSANGASAGATLDTAHLNAGAAGEVTKQGSNLVANGGGTVDTAQAAVKGVAGATGGSDGLMAGGVGTAQVAEATGALVANVNDLSGDATAVGQAGQVVGGAISGSTH